MARSLPTPLRVEPLAFKSKSQAVYTEIRQRILRGDLVAASSLNQEQLAAALGVSTTPLREALRWLEAEGLVQTVAHREIIVAPLSATDLSALYEVRLDLDPLAAELAAQRYDSKDRELMVAAAEALSLDRGDELVARNREFHTAIYRACHNPVLIRLLDSLWDQADRYRWLISVVARDMRTADEHQALLGAVLERRPDDAARLMREHLVLSREAIEQRVRAEEAGSTASV